jgi:hypothetical protein
MRNLTVKGMVTALRMARKDLADFGQVAQQAGAAVAADDALGGAAQVEVDGVEAGFFDDAGGFGEEFRDWSRRVARRWGARRRRR